MLEQIMKKVWWENRRVGGIFLKSPSQISSLIWVHEQRVNSSISNIQVRDTVQIST